MSQNFKLQGGYTLIEFLVVIVVLIVVGSIVVGVITFSLRGANKTNTIENIRQNGNYVISQMAKDIGYARSFDGLSTDGITYVTSCPATQPSPTPTSTNYSYIKVTPFNSSSIIYSCSNVGGLPTVVYQKPPGLAVSLIPSSIQVSNCSFTCTVTSVTDLPIIKIRFILQPIVTSTLVEKFAAPINFETSVSMRNYQR